MFYLSSEYKEIMRGMIEVKKSDKSRSFLFDSQ
ncbi:hypothetical protein CSE899_13934 [Cronobacter sakazakii E899]|nr:hypothetical protein CSE899_13934 [Cronobacter sakazakii E899]